MKNEVWLDIIGYEGLYKVSDLGRVKAKSAVTNQYHKEGEWYEPKLRLVGSRDNNKYYQLALYKNGVRKEKKLHRVVAEAFIPNPENKPQVNHINGIKTDNRVENLEWCTNSENQKHAYDNGFHKPIKGKDNSTSKKVHQYDLQGNFIKTWDSIGDANMFYCGRRNGSIYYNCVGKTTNAYGYLWSFNTGDVIIPSKINIRKSKKLYIVSDIHGHYYEMLDGLRKAGYDDENNEHLLIVMGDLFDRGKYSKEIYRYLKNLYDKKKAIVLRGNHEKFFIDWLKGDDNPFNFVRNGMSYTIDSFLGFGHSFDNYCIQHECGYTPSSFAKYSEVSRKYILENEPELLEWLENLPYYYETENYIFTHASIDTKANDWRHPHCEYYSHLDWDACVWDDGSFFGSTICNTDKTIVIGHFDTGQLRKKYGLGSKDDHSILPRKDGRVIAIDGCVALTKEVNVVIIYGEKI